jgi:hypothetical protein
VTSARVHVAVCTYEPDERHLAEQITSILSQEAVDLTVTICDDGSRLPPIVDDQRVNVVAGERLGVFHNFERALRHVPAGVEMVLLSDQDDIWHPRKARTLLAALQADPTVRLVHSDARLINDAGSVLAGSMFAAEQRNVAHIDVDHLIAKNVVSGCTAAFRPSLLSVALPFPTLGDSTPFHHDLWLALCAAATGRIATVHQPLIDYRQHLGNVLGVQERRNLWRDPSLALREWQARQQIVRAIRAAAAAGQLPAETAHQWAPPFGVLHVLRLGAIWAMRREPQASSTLALGLAGAVLAPAGRIKRWLRRGS